MKPKSYNELLSMWRDAVDEERRIQMSIEQKVCPVCGSVLVVKKKFTLFQILGTAYRDRRTCPVDASHCDKIITWDTDPGW